MSIHEYLNVGIEVCIYISITSITNIECHPPNIEKMLPYHVVVTMDAQLTIKLVIGNT